MRMFYDSLEGNCRDWVKGFPTNFIDSIISLWDIFLKTWIEKSKFVADHVLPIPLISDSNKQQYEDVIQEYAVVDLKFLTVKLVFMLHYMKNLMSLMSLLFRIHCSHMSFMKIMLF
jgi:hypothetical protein